ncbi:MAG: putative pre6S rRNA nuclease [Gaiellales bacterium]|jgi:putative Holliday junction resolvase|nr:putative pre6S rRNA nuclease [Gaiellales bacterium]
MKVLALDYGRARTGVAVSDATGTLARPVGVVDRVRTPRGLSALVARIAEHEPERVVVGLPLTLRGEEGGQARETRDFVRELSARCEVPVELYDERFTTVMAARTTGAGGDDAVAAAHLLEGYLERLRSAG